MADFCLPLSAGEHTFKLNLVQLELEDVEKQIRELLGKQAQLRERRAMLETSRANAHKSGVSMQCAANTPTTSTPCVSLHRPCAPRTRSSQMSFTPAPGNHRLWMQQQRKTWSRPRATSSPPLPSPVFEISTRVLNVSVQIPAILKDDESVAAVVIHIGVNDSKIRQRETLKRDFRSLIETVRSTSPATTIIVSGPLATYRRGNERFKRLFALHEWLLSW